MTLLECASVVLYGVGVFSYILDVTFSSKMTGLRTHAAKRYLVIIYASILVYGVLWPVTVPTQVTARILLQRRERRKRTGLADLPPRF